MFSLIWWCWSTTSFIRLTTGTAHPIGRRRQKNTHSSSYLSATAMLRQTRVRERRRNGHQPTPNYPSAFCNGGELQGEKHCTTIRCHLNEEQKQERTPLLLCMSCPSPTTLPHLLIDFWCSHQLSADCDYQCLGEEQKTNGVLGSRPYLATPHHSGVKVEAVKWDATDVTRFSTADQFKEENSSPVRELGRRYHLGPWTSKMIYVGF
jgi:hypothetical protein